MNVTALKNFTPTRIRLLGVSVEARVEMVVWTLENFVTEVLLALTVIVMKDLRLPLHLLLAVPVRKGKTQERKKKIPNKKKIGVFSDPFFRFVS